MTCSRTLQHRVTTIPGLAPLALALSLAGGLGLAACSNNSGSSSSTTSSSSSASTGGGSSAAGYTFSAASVPGLGTVLVDGNRMTLYILSSEAGGTINCTDGNGCTKIWPDTELPSGVMSAIAGPGVDSSKLSTVKSPDGHLYPTYSGYPLYTFSGDTGPGQSHGQGIQSFGGTWYAIQPNGSPVMSASPAMPSTSGSPSTSMAPFPSSTPASTPPPSPPPTTKSWA